MLGGFSLVYGKKPLPNNYSGTSKMMQLFQILLYAGREGIPRAELIERLYGREELEDAGATLRVNIYRLRKYIQKLNCFENTDCIWFQEGLYRWNYCAVPLERDTDRFRLTAEEALQETDPDKKAELLKEACRMYRGNSFRSWPARSGLPLKAASTRSCTWTASMRLPLCCGKDRSTKNFWNLALRPAEFTFSRNII